MNTRVIILLAVSVAAALAAPQRKSKVETSATLSDVAIDNYASDMRQSSVATDKGDGTVDAQFKPLKASSKFKERSAALKSADGTASAVGGSGKKAVARKTGAGTADAMTLKHKAKGAVNGQSLSGTGNSATGNADFQKVANGQEGTLTGTGKGKNGEIDVQTDSAQKVYTADNDKIDAEMDVATASKNAGSGTATFNDKPAQDVAFAREGESLQASVRRAGQAPGRSTPSWECDVVKSGESTCIDQNGNKAGRVVVDEEGKVLVYNKRGLPIGRGNAYKQADGSYKVTLNDKDGKEAGLFTAEVGEFTKGSCYQEVAGRRQRKTLDVEVKSVHMEYNGKKLDDGVQVAFPDCFDVVATVQLARGVKVSDLAVEFDVNVNPLGRLSCLDDFVSSSKGCYYSDICSLSAKNAEGDACSVKGGARPVEVRTTVCPPPEDTKAAACSRFDRSIISQVTNAESKSIEAKVLVWQRAKSKESAAKTWALAQSNPITGRLAMRSAAAAYALENPGTNWNTVDKLTQYTYYERFVTREQLLDCQEGEMEYNFGGEKVDSDVLLRLVQTGKDAKGNQLSVFEPEPCDEWRSRAEERYEEATATEAPGRLGQAFNGLLGRLG